MYPVGTGTKEDFEQRWYIALGFGEKTDYGYHEGIDVNLRTGGDTDLGEPIKAIADWELTYYHLSSHTEAGFGVHFVYTVNTPRGRRWIHCAHNQPDPPVVSKKTGKKGDILAFIGKTGRPRNIMPAHLHFSVFKVDPASLSNKIDTIAKTSQQLNDWWESPLETIESLLAQKETMEITDQTKIPQILSPNGDVMEVQAIRGELYDRRKNIQAKDDEIRDLQESLISAESRAGDSAQANAMLIEDKARLQTKVAEFEENLRAARSERDQASWKAEKLEIENKRLQEDKAGLTTDKEDLTTKNENLRLRIIELTQTKLESVSFWQFIKFKLGR